MFENFCCYNSKDTEKSAKTLKFVQAHVFKYDFSQYMYVGD